MPRKIAKIITLNMVIAIINIVAFSKGLMGLSIKSDNVFVMGVSIFIPVLSALILGYGNYMILTKSEELIYYDVQKLDKPDECIDALKKASKMLPYLRDEFNQLKEQISRIIIKNVALGEFMEQMGLEGEQVIEESMKKSTEYILYNVRVVLAKAIILVAKDSSDDFQKEKDSIQQVIKQNEEYLRMYDDFLDEVMRMKERKKLSEMSELDLETTIQALSNLRNMRGG